MIQSLNNKPVKEKKTTISKVLTVTTQYKSIVNSLIKLGVKTQKWAMNNKQSLLGVARNMQDVGDKTAELGTGIAIVGSVLGLGVGATPGIALGAAGRIGSVAGTGLEVAIDFIAGNYKDGEITTGNTMLYRCYA